MLRERWLALCGKIQREGAGEWRALQSAYRAPERAYHNLDHIEDCLARFDEYSGLAADPVAVELAIWFHDVVYDPRASDNEERSAEAARSFLGDTSLAEHVSDLIVATRHDGQPGSEDALLLCDIDLSILGREPARYDEYAAAIRREYEWVPQAEYAKGRASVLEAFLQRAQIYRVRQIRERLERPARTNLQVEIDRLRKEHSDNDGNSSC